jgi:branched-subunit amino acid aminotransferase/4-amino-4-deoxychorismate lyase
LIAYLNGAWLDEKEAFIPIHDRGFLHADGVFETGLLYRGSYFHLRAHLDRLANSASLLGIPAPDTPGMMQAAREIAARNHLEEGSLRITLTAPASGHAGVVLMTIAPRDPAWIARAAAGWRINTARTTRPSTEAIPAQLKALGRTYALLARREAVAGNVDDVLLLTDQGMVCEGPSWNVFWRTANVIYTPSLELGVLAGITRSILVHTARVNGYEVREGAYPRADLDAADEIFATMTSVGIAPIRQLDGRTLPEETPAADMLFDSYWSQVAAVCERGGE